MIAFIRRRPVLSAFTVAYVVAVEAWALWTGRPQAVAYAVQMVAAIAVVLAFHSRVGLSVGVLWALAAWGLAHMAGGLVPVGDAVLYNAPLWADVVRFDRIVHAFGFGTATVACHQALAPVMGTHPRAAGRAVALAFLAGLGLGAINETIEFLSTKVLPETNVGGFDNTGWDMVANTLGCAAAAVGLRGRAALPRGGQDR